MCVKLLYYSNFLLFPITTLNQLTTALHIRLTVFEITCCNFGTGCLTVGQNTAKIAKSNMEEYATPGLDITGMHLQMEQLNESFRKN